MNRSTLIIIGCLILSFLGMLAGFYYFYPQLNEERFAEITSTAEEQPSTDLSLVGTPYLRTYDDITNQIERLMSEQMSLQNRVDSLQSLEAELINRLAELEEEMNRPGNQPNLAESAGTPQNNANVTGTQAQPQAQQPQNMFADIATVQMEEEQEAFADRVKSLLNLEEEELAPILTRLNNDQLIRLYRSAGNIQREKLLRSLNPDRAARLMESIML